MGGTAGAISKTAAAPIERVKLLIQNQGAMIKAGRLDRPYSGIIDCFKRTYADEGVVSCRYMILGLHLPLETSILLTQLLPSLAWERNQRHKILPHAGSQLCFQGLLQELIRPQEV
jgi:hypothetical protein